MTKWLWIVAGPNGAGKSTHTAKLVAAAQAANPDVEIIKLNADERTAELKQLFPDRPQRELNLQAAQETDASLAKAIAGDKPAILVETVLSSEKYKDDVLEAKAREYNIGLMFVSVYPPELILQRIETRVLRGGHNVESQKALERYTKSHANLIWFGQHADKLFILDNTSPSGPVLVATKEAGKKLEHRAKGVNHVLDHAIRALQKGKSYSPPLKQG